MRRFLDFFRRLAIPGLAKALADRDSLSIDEIRQRYYPETTLTSEEFEKLWRDIAAVFYVPAEVMRPTDRFGVELPLRISFAGNDEDIMLGGVLARHERRFGIKTPMPDPKSVNDVISYIAEHRTD